MEKFKYKKYNGIYFDYKHKDNPKYPELNGKPSDTQDNPFIIAMDNDYFDQKGKCSKSYHKFDSMADYLIWVKTVPETERCFYEIIPEYSTQRIFFDIEKNDLTHPPTENYKNYVISNMIYAISAVLEHNKNTPLQPLRDIVVCESITDDKFSIHIILNGYYVESIHENKRFCQMVVSKLSKEVADIIDTSVYTKNRPFRILGCRKRNKILKPTKKLCNFIYNGITSVAHNNDIEYQKMYKTIIHDNSFISGNDVKIQFSDDKSSPATPGYQKSNSSSYSNGKDDVSIFVLLGTTEDVDLYKNRVSKKISQYLGFDILNKSSPLQYKNIDKNKILIHRTKSSFCKACKRTHDSMDGFAFTYIGMDGKSIYLSYSCGRMSSSQNNKRSVCLGIIGEIKTGYDIVSKCAHNYIDYS